MVLKMAISTGFDTDIQMITEGGYWLDQFLSGEMGNRVDETLAEKNWDYVILQGQSAEPALERERFLKAAAKMCQKVRNIGAIPLIYQTWSYQDGTEKLETTGMDYRGFYEALKAGCQQAGAENGAEVVPVGDLFFRHCQPMGTLTLMADDAHHPTLRGSYVAAMCFYAKLFGTEKPPMWRPKAVSQSEADELWSDVASTVEK